jgi:hypothetical protein
MAYRLPLNKTEREEAKYGVKDRYNGWHNLNTWQVALNIDNDEGIYESSRDAIRDGAIKDGESYKAWFKEYAQTDEEGFYKVFDGWSEKELDNDVDWDEIYETHKKELEE